MNEGMDEQNIVEHAAKRTRKAKAPVEGEVVEAKEAKPPKEPKTPEELAASRELAYTKKRELNAHLAGIRVPKESTFNLKVAENPKKPAGASSKRFQAYFNTVTVGEAMAPQADGTPGVTMGDVRYDILHNFITVTLPDGMVLDGPQTS